MAERLVVLVENDPVLSERIRAVLAANGFRVDVLTDGNELLLGPQLFPQLIILCIDPKRLGWAVCNKIKKTAQYRETPMIVTSQEATDKDFEDHKKLRTRAEEYLHKPFSVEVLLGRIDALVGLKVMEDEDVVEAIDDAAIEEISVDDAAVVEEEPAAPSTGTPRNRGEIDQEIADDQRPAQEQRPLSIVSVPALRTIERGWAAKVSAIAVAVGGVVVIERAITIVAVRDVGLAFVGVVAP